MHECASTHGVLFKWKAQFNAFFFLRFWYIHSNKPGLHFLEAHGLRLPIMLVKGCYNYQMAVFLNPVLDTNRLTQNEYKQNSSTEFEVLFKLLILQI